MLKVLMLVMAVITLSNCASTPEGKAKWAGVFKAMGDYGQRQSDQANARLAASSESAAARAAKSHEAQVSQTSTPTSIDYRCQGDCVNAGYALNLCRKQCSY